MSAKALTWARDQHPLTASGKPDPEAKLVLYALTDMDNEDDKLNRVWPSQALLRQRTSLAVSTIGKRLQSLERGGYLTRSRRSHMAGPRKGQRTSDMIMLHLEKPADPPLAVGEQPPGLREASRQRVHVAPSRPGPGDVKHEEVQRRRWEESLGDEWRQEGPWWDSAADTVAEVLLVDAVSGEVFESLGPFDNFDRPAQRRRPTEMWTQSDVLDEIIDRIRWIDGDNRVDVDEIVSAYWDRDLKGPFDARREVLAVAGLFGDGDFLQDLACDDGSGAVAVMAALHSVYESPIQVVAAS